MNTFPPLRVAVLSALRELKEDLSHLDRNSCPYDEETKKLIKALLEPKVVEKIVEKQITGPGAVGRPSKDIKLSEEDQQKVLDEILTNLKDLRDLKLDEMDTNAKIQVIKSRSTLTEQMLKMQERHTSVVKTEQFKETVIRILDEIVDEKGREQFMKRLEEFR
jgi:aminoglycoside phosphotransferase